MIIKLDDKGRLVIPKAIREMMGIEHKGKVELRLNGNKLIVTKGE